MTGLSLPSMGSCSLEQSQTAALLCSFPGRESCVPARTLMHIQAWADRAFRTVVPSLSPAHCRASFYSRTSLSLNASRREICFANQYAWREVDGLCGVWYRHFLSCHSAFPLHPVSMVSSVFGTLCMPESGTPLIS